MADVAIARRAGTASTRPRPVCRTRKLAMWLFLASECLLFGALISTYLLYRGASIERPYPADVFDIAVHVGVVVRAAGELAHDGARARRRAAAGHRARCGCGC